MPLHILMAGATGCLGRALVSQFLADGHHVTAVVRPDNVDAELPRGAEPIAMDLASPFAAASLPATCDVVVHAAQSRRYRDFPAAADEIFQINVAATHALANYAVRAQARQFVFFSTGSVYAPKQGPVDEAGEVAPTTFYAASKLAAEILLAPYAPLLSVLVFRLFYMYGPGQSQMLVTRLAESILENKPIVLDGRDGICLTPTLSSDVARVCSQAIEERWQGVFNVANPQIVPLRDLATELGRVLGTAPRYEAKSDKIPLSVIPDTRKLGALFDLSRMTTIADGLEQTFSPPSSGRTSQGG